MADEQTLSEEYFEKLQPNTILQLIAAAFAMFENCLAFIMYTKYVENKSGSRFFIPILAIVDLGGCVSILTQFYLNNIMHNIYPSFLSCKMMTFVIVLTGVFSSHVIFAIALERYLVVRRPFCIQMTKKFKKIAILILFLISVGYASPVLKFERMSQRKSLDFTVNLPLCFTDHNSDNSIVIAVYLGILLFLSFINIVVTSLLYIPVIKTIYGRPYSCRQNRTKKITWRNIETDFNEMHISPIGRNTITDSPLEAVTESDKPLRIDKRREQKDSKNISVMFLVIIVIYVVSYLTSLVTQIHSFARNGYLANIYVFCLRFNLLNHIANPYVYLIFDLKLRNELQRICCSRLFRR